MTQNGIRTLFSHGDVRDLIVAMLKVRGTTAGLQFGVEDWIWHPTYIVPRQQDSAVKRKVWKDLGKAGRSS
jgi:hypothetical protein